MRAGTARQLISVRAAGWALRARFEARHAVYTAGVSRPVGLSAAPNVPVEAVDAVLSVLAWTRATCLVRSLVLQRWYADHGELHDVVIGVTAPSEGFRAHAWLDRPGDEDNSVFSELHRLPGQYALGTGPRYRSGR